MNYKLLDLDGELIDLVPVKTTDVEIQFEKRNSNRLQELFKSFGEDLKIFDTKVPKIAHKVLCDTENFNVEEQFALINLEKDDDILIDYIEGVQVVDNLQLTFTKRNFLNFVLD